MDPDAKRQIPRQYGDQEPSVDLKYRPDAIMAAFECGPQPSLLTRAIEFKAFDTLDITEAVLTDKAKKSEFIRVFVIDRVIKYACAAINARVNMVLYFGVADDGRVVGVKVESFELVIRGSEL